MEPNAIHFQKSFQGFVELSENPMVLSVVLAILGIYLLLLIWARRRDIRNAKKVYISHLLFSSFPFLFFSFISFYFYFSSSSFLLLLLFWKLIKNNGISRVGNICAVSSFRPKLFLWRKMSHLIATNTKFWY